MQGCHATCGSFSFVTVTPVSFAALHSTALHFRSIPPRSLLNILLKGMAHLATHNSKHTNGHMPFASQQHGSLGSIPLRSSLFPFSPAQSTRCPLFCSPVLPTSAAFAKCCPDHNARHMAHSYLISPCSTKLSCIVRPLRTLTGNLLRWPPMELASASFVGLYCQPLVGGSQARPVVPPSRALRRLASSASAPTSLRGKPLLLFSRRRFYRQT
jgi:hypothetical protein